MSTSNLFQPIKIGKDTLQHRIVLAPMTRFKASSKAHVPSNPLVKTFYSQRGSAPGTLLITEGTFIDPRAGGYDNAPGIWNKDQINAWHQVWSVPSSLYTLTQIYPRSLMLYMQGDHLYTSSYGH